jgi:hypothetical protein
VIAGSTRSARRIDASVETHAVNATATTTATYDSGSDALSP